MNGGALPLAETPANWLAVAPVFGATPLFGSMPVRAAFGPFISAIACDGKPVAGGVACPVYWLLRGTA